MKKKTVKTLSLILNVTGMIIAILLPVFMNTWYLYLFMSYSLFIGLFNLLKLYLIKGESSDTDEKDPKRSSREKQGKL